MNSIYYQYIAKFFLSFSHDTILVPVMIIGFCAFKRNVFGQAFCLLLFTMIFVTLLKCIFRIPLNPLVGKGFAFPSGHMQSALVFYGWLVVNMRDYWLKGLLMIVLFGIGSALVYFGYHNIIDIVGAISFGITTIAILYGVAQHRLFQKYPFLMGLLLSIVSSFMMLYLYYTNLWYITEVNREVWASCYVLLGFAAAWAVLYQYLALPQSKLTIVVSMAISGITIAVAMYISSLIHQSNMELPFQFQWILVGLAMPLSVRIGQYKW